MNFGNKMQKVEDIGFAEVLLIGIVVLLIGSFLGWW